jgi:large subunit ribosomal protein L30
MAEPEKTARTAQTANTARTPTPAKAEKSAKPATSEKTVKSEKTAAERAMARLRITYVKSVIGYSQRQRDTIKSLGLRRLHQSVEHTDTPEIRGMVNKVSHLVRVEEVAG